MAIRLRPAFGPGAPPAIGRSQTDSRCKSLFRAGKLAVLARAIDCSYPLRMAYLNLLPFSTDAMLLLGTVLFIALFID